MGSTAVHGVAKSQTLLSKWTECNCAIVQARKSTVCWANWKLRQELILQLKKKKFFLAYSWFDPAVLRQNFFFSGKPQFLLLRPLTDWIRYNHVSKYHFFYVKSYVTFYMIITATKYPSAISSWTINTYLTPMFHIRELRFIKMENLTKLIQGEPNAHLSLLTLNPVLFFSTQSK